MKTTLGSAAAFAIAVSGFSCSHTTVAKPVTPQPILTEGAPKVREPGRDESPAGPSKAASEEAIYFNLDAALIKDDARETLQEVANRLQHDSRARVRIEGNCDERGTTEYNLALGESRARAARDYLVRLGVEPNRIEIVTFGSERPRNSAHDEDAWAQNRRDDFRVR